jgi:hypothetical protein
MLGETRADCYLLYRRPPSGRHFVKPLCAATRLALLIPVLLAPRATSAQAIAIPSRLVADRFFVTPVLASGDTLSLFTDTGGGMWILRSELDRRQLPVQFMMMSGRDSMFGVAPSIFREGAGIPTPLGSVNNFIYVYPEARIAAALPLLDGAHGMLGQQWFSSRVWIFDYPAKRMSYYVTPPPPRPFGPNTIPATVRTPPRTSYPRVRTVIDGDSVDMLFDTGATILLTPDALRTLGDGGPAVRGGSFIKQSVAAGWRARHPDWRYIPAAEQNGADLIEVPRVTIAGHTVGPVWFATRPDQAYDVTMRQMMDAPIAGALGGNALRTFRITMDYPNQRVTFER